MCSLGDFKLKKYVQFGIQTYMFYSDSFLTDTTSHVVVFYKNFKSKKNIYDYCGHEFKRRGGKIYNQ